jgi:hypothetical protein
MFPGSPQPLAQAPPMGPPGFQPSPQVMPQRPPSVPPSFQGQRNGPSQALLASAPEFPPPVANRPASLQPKIRMQAPDDPPRADRPLTLPMPEDLGVRPPTTPVAYAAVDWNALRDRLSRLGVTSFRVDTLSAGGHRVTFLVPTQEKGRTRHIETTAATEAAAVQLALEQVERVR